MCVYEKKCVILQIERELFASFFYTTNCFTINNNNGTHKKKKKNHKKNNYYEKESFIIADASPASGQGGSVYWSNNSELRDPDETNYSYIMCKDE